MTTCPVCMNEANNDGDCCSVCGYHFQDATEAFEAISIDTEGERAHAADQAPASLRVCYGKQEGLVFPLESDFIEIGRSPQCGVMLNDMTVSRVHAEMEKINGEWTISMLKDYQAQGIELPDWDVTYLPAFDTTGDIVSPGGLSTFISVCKNSQHPDEAFRFVQFMAGEEANVYLAGQGVLPAFANDAVKASFAEAVGVPGAATLLDTTITLETPSVPGYSELSTAFGEERKKAWKTSKLT